MNQIAERTILTLAKQTGIAPQCISDEHTLRNELQCDSLDCVECMMALEEEFGIEIDEDKFDKLETVQQIIEYVTGVCTETVCTETVCTETVCTETVCANKIEHLSNDEFLVRLGRMITMAVKVTCELDTIKNITEPLSIEEKNRIQRMVEESHDALESIGISYPLAEDIKIDDTRFAHDCSTASLVIE
jgi:acyl carrier protein